MRSVTISDVSFASLFLRAFAVIEPGARGIFTQLLTDVRENPAIYARLNDINSQEIMLRVFYRDGVIFAVADLPVLPFVGSHVAEAFGYFCDAADRLGIQLKALFGGETAFEDSVQSNMLH